MRTIVYEKENCVANDKHQVINTRSTRGKQKENWSLISDLIKSITVEYVFLQFRPCICQGMAVLT